MAAKLGVVLLAAGASRRMGRCKPLLPVQGEPAIRFCLRRMINAGLETIIVVIGAHREKIRPVLSDLPVGIAINAMPDTQMAESVSIGLSAMPESVTGIMVALCDHPLVSSGTYAALKAHHDKTPDSILIPVCKGRGGHPTVFPRSLCRAVDKGIPLNRVVNAYPDHVRRIPMDDPGVILDMDTPADYHRMLRLAGRPTEASMG